MGPEIRTLVVDDNEDISRMFETLLGLNSDFTVVGVAHNGLEAIEKASLLWPELILLDVMMPHMDGIAALPHLRAQVPDAKIVFLSVLLPQLVEHRLREPAAEGCRPDAIITKSELIFSMAAVKELFAE